MTKLDLYGILTETVKQGDYKMAEQKKIVSKKSKFSAEKKGKYWVFTCDCGSEMWNNIYKKNTAKSPDLRCKDADCSCGDKGKPHAIWLNDKQKDALGIKEKAQTSNTSSNKSKSGSYSKGSYNDFSNGTPFSMYAAWAKDVAIYLAKATGVKAHDEFDALYRTCLENMEASIKSHEAKLVSVKAPADEQIKDLDAEDSMDIDDPEDVNEDSIDDIDSEEKKVDDDFEGLDDLDL